MLSQKAMLVTLSFGLPKLSAVDKEETRKLQLVHGTKDGQQRVVKELWDEADIKPFKSLRDEFRFGVHYKWTLPWLRNGLDVLASADYMDYQAQAREFGIRWWKMVDDFVKVYETKLDRAKAALNGMFKASDYMTPNEVRSRFRFDLTFTPIPTAGDFRLDGIDEVEKAMLDAELLKQQVEAAGKLQAQLCQRIVETVQGLTNGKVSEATLKNVQDLVDRLPSLNFNDDPMITDICRELQTKVCSVQLEGKAKEVKASKEVAAKAADDIVKRMAMFMA